jgi:hypothetical protein
LLAEFILSGQKQILRFAQDDSLKGFSATSRAAARAAIPKVIHPYGQVDYNEDCTNQVA